MLTKQQLADALEFELEILGVDGADEIADSVVEKLDEDGAFDVDVLDE